MFVQIYRDKYAYYTRSMTVMAKVPALRVHPQQHVLTIVSRR
jgi:hypothetical protein